MATPRQAKSPAVKRLDKQKVRVALIMRGWSQAELAVAINRSLTAVNLTINHGTYPAIADQIRKELSL